MGGFGSTRWNGKRTRQDTDPLLSLDVRWLKRQGALEPGAVARPHWTNRMGEPSGDIVTVMEESGEALTLDYRVRRIGESAWVPIRDHVRLERTPCHFGGVRVWFRCPGCGSRRSLLYSVGGQFRCRQCHDLAYTSTRQDPFLRGARQIRRLQRKLGKPQAGYPLWGIPEKPKGMHWRTYRHIREQLKSAIAERESQLEFRLMAMTAGSRLGRLYGHEK